jgi:hypothetical protein
MNSYNKEEVNMNNEEKELLKKYRDMFPDTKSDVLSYIRGAHTAQENTRRKLIADYEQYGLTESPPKRTA